MGLLSIDDGWKWVNNNTKAGNQRHCNKMFCWLYCDKCSMDGWFGVIVGNESLVHHYTASQDWYEQAFVERFIALMQHDAHIQEQATKQMTRKS